MTLHERSCMLDAAVELTGIPVEELLSFVGHDGDWGFDPLEIVAALFNQGIYTTILPAKYDRIVKLPCIVIKPKTGIISHASVARKKEDIEGAEWLIMVDGFSGKE